MNDLTADELDAAFATVTLRYPELTGEALHAKVRRIAAIMRHSQDASVWTARR